MANDSVTTSKQLTELVVAALQDKKGFDIMYIDFTKASNTVAKYFVICHGSSNIHAGTLAGGVLDSVKQNTGTNPYNREGLENAEWILLDYADVVVHIFQENTRKFYNLEGLWADMETTRVKSS